jgi:RNA polymerase sigma-70 factor, ECF subfamily
MTINSNEFSQMYTRLYKTVYYFVLFKINNPEEAKDIASEVFMTAFRTWGEMPENDEMCKKYLIVTAKSRIIDFYRRHHTNFSVNSTQKRFIENSEGSEDESFFERIASDEPLPETYFAKSEDSQSAIKLLNLVDGSDRQVLISRYIEDMTYKEMSEVYEMKEQSLRKKVERALEKIKLKVEEKIK